MSVPEAIIFLTCFLIHVSPLRTSLDENQVNIKQRFTWGPELLGQRETVLLKESMEGSH